MNKLTGAEIVIECLKEQGVDTVFGYPGGTILNIYDALYKHQDEITHILTSHEQGAAHAADGYARATGKVGVCMATSGPGATNLVTGIATACMDSIPVVAITCNVAVSLLGRDSFQEIDIAGITMPITKYNFIVKDITKLADTIRRAFTIAQTGRPGPVLIDITKDVTANSCDYEYKAPEPIERQNSTITEEDMEKALYLIRNAKKPFIFAGGGAVIADAADELKSFAHKIQAPVADSLMGKGAFDGTDELYTGMVGMHGTKTSNFGITECDLLIVVGARFSDRVTGNAAKFAPNAKILQFDVDPAEIDKNVKTYASVIGDVKTILKKLNARLDPVNHDEWLAHIDRMKDMYPLRYDKNLLTGPYVVEQIYELTQGDAVITTEVGQHQMWAAQFYNTEKPRHFITSGGLGTMGYGLPAAMGAKLACPGQTVLLLSGDGSIMMNCQEFATLADNGIAVKTVVLCNSVLGMVNQWQRMFYHRRYAASLLKKGNRIPAISEAMGVPGFTATTPDTLDEAIEKFLSVPGPALLEVRIPADENVYPMVPGGKRLNEMILEGGSRT